uniref:Fibronectin type-III domain-containing protein n=1 Tax=Oryza glumipatula TaxID=40148 RepID=A0A0D9YME4_9ORYZ
MDPPYAGVPIDPAKCRLMSVDEKRELVRELSKRPESAPDKLQSWSRREIVEILCADLGRERKYTGLSKQRMLEYLFRVVTGKSSGGGAVEHVQEKEPTPEPNTANHQSPAKRQRKSDNPSRLPIVASSPTTEIPRPASNARFCHNLACRATLNPEDKFCRRCSCCICFKYDDNKDPSLWLFCSSDQPLQKDSCVFSCHLECALKDGRTGIMQSGQCKKLDGGYYCTRCRKQNDLLGSWKKQLVIAKDARRLDVLCHRIFLSHKILVSTEKYFVLHEIVDTAMKKLEAEVGPISGVANMGRGIVSRLAVGAEVQKLCARAIETMESLFCGSPSNSQFQRSRMIPSNFVKFEAITQTSVTVVLDLGPILAQDVTCFNVWHRVAATGSFSSSPTGIILAPLKTLVVTQLVPATSYIFKVVAFSNSKEFGSWEAKMKTSCQKEVDLKGLMPGGSGLDQNNGSPKANSGGQSDPSSEGVDSNNNTAVYADLNKSPESDFEYCENPEILDSDKASHHPNEPTNNSQSMPMVIARVTEVSGLEEAPGLSASALDEEPNSAVQTQLLRESSNSMEQNQRSEVPGSQDASNAPAGNEVVIVPPRYSGSIPPTAPRYMENGKDISGRSLKAKPGDNILQNGSSKPEREPGNSSNKRTSGKCEEIGHKDGCPEASYEYCVKVVRWLECEGYIETNFRVKFLTWYSLRATPHDRKIVSVYVNTLIDDPVSLSGQLADTFSEAIYSKRPPSVRSGFCMELWH